jgi:CheY-like chemotaxis protein
MTTVGIKSGQSVARWAANVMNSDPILLAEDNEDHVILIRRAFEKGALCNPLFVVRDGAEAIDYLSGTGKFANRDEFPVPSLLLLDLKMPNKDGFEVLQWVRHQPGLSRLRVVVLTTSEDWRDINRAYQLGANSFLVKPVNMDEFFRLTQAIKGYWLWMSKEPDLHRPDEKKVQEHPAASEELPS